jgi:hypothetical protein
MRIRTTATVLALALFFVVGSAAPLSCCPLRGAAPHRVRAADCCTVMVKCAASPPVAPVRLVEKGVSSLPATVPAGACRLSPPTARPTPLLSLPTYRDPLYRLHAQLLI